MDFSTRIALGVLWVLGGLIWLRRATQDDARPNDPVSVFSTPELKPDKERSWQVHIAALDLMLAAVYLFAAFFTRNR